MQDTVKFTKAYRRRKRKRQNKYTQKKWPKLSYIWWSSWTLCIHKSLEYLSRIYSKRFTWRHTIQYSYYQKTEVGGERKRENLENKRDSSGMCGSNTINNELLMRNLGVRSQCNNISKEIKRKQCLKKNSVIQKNYHLGIKAKLRNSQINQCQGTSSLLHTVSTYPTRNTKGSPLD